ncbi:biosynthetic peptidoglycan transglycosylase [soil metagenome]
MEKKVFLWVGVSLIALVLVAVVVGVSLRNRILMYVVQTVVTKVENKYPAELVVKDARFLNYNTVALTDIALVPHDRDTLLTTDSLFVVVSLRSLLRMRPVFSELNIAHAYFTPVKRDSIDNYSFLYRSDKEIVVDTTKGSNYGRLLNQLIETAFENVPEQVSFRNLNVLYDDQERNLNMHMPFLTVQEGVINTRLTLETDSLLNHLQVVGAIDPKNYNISGSLYAEERKGIQLPFVKRKFGGEVYFDTLRFSLTDKVYRNEILTIRGSAEVKNMDFNHPDVSHEDVTIDQGAIDYVISIGENYYSLDSLTRVSLNHIIAYPQVSYRSKPSKVVDIKVKMEKTPATEFFASLPIGMFINLEGIQAKGAISYSLDMHIDMANLDGVRFDSDLEGHGLEIVDYGKADLSKINRSFEHTVYEYGEPVRTFTVGPQNPFYVRYHEISPYIKNTLLTSEDAGFFRHKGFHEEAFRQSIIVNLRKGDFVRGGSTISMQLVKNVFLTRQKTIARKVEEALIVWLIENLEITPKQRMFEVYLNIIEWGPNVYGIKDASRFYFGKDPASLNLSESIYLASIVPKPKAFKYSFDKYGNLRGNVASYYRLISGIMVRRGLISQEEYENLYPRVELYGRARSLIVTAELPPQEMEDSDDPESPIFDDLVDTY